MDSTFLGTLASIAIHQRQRDGTSLVATNVNDHVRGLLETLGLKYLMQIRPPSPDASPDAAKQGARDFEPAHAPQLSRIDQIVMMLEAHQHLVDLDSQNEIKFEGVLKSLRDSLEREKDRQK
jgi:hypothetical protein